MHEALIIQACHTPRGMGTRLNELERCDLTSGLVNLCAGGGLAPAIIIERV